MWLVYCGVTTVCWGLIYALNEETFRYRISPATLILCGYLTGLPALLIGWGGTFRVELPRLIAEPRLGGLVLLGNVVAVAANLCSLYAVRGRNATVVALLQLSYPLFVVAFSWVLFRQHHLTWPVAVGGLLMLSGAVVFGLAASGAAR